MATNENTMEIKSEVKEIGGEKSKCLVCLSEIEPNTDSFPIHNNNFLEDVLPLFGISNSWVSLDSSTSCCSSCFQIIDQAKRTSEEVSKLQLTLSSLLDSLKCLLKRSYRTFSHQQQAEDTGQTIRQALVQCWTTCEVPIKKLSVDRTAKRRRIRKLKSEIKSEVDAGNNMVLSGTLNQSMNEWFAMNLTAYVDTQIEEDGGKKDNKLECLKSGREVPREEKAKGIFRCQYCKNLYRKENFFQKQHNRYIFKCELPNCTQIAQNFRVFSKHHEAQCPKNPNGGKWKPRQKPTSEKMSEANNCSENTMINDSNSLVLLLESEAAVNTDEKELQQPDQLMDDWFGDSVVTSDQEELSHENSSQEQVLGSEPTEFKTNQLAVKKMDAFRCKYCRREYTKASFFQKQRNRFIFICDLPNCTQVMQNFMVLRKHHEASCPKNPNYAKWKPRQKAGNDKSEKSFSEKMVVNNPLQLQGTETDEHVHEINAAKKKMPDSFQCKYCHQEYAKESYFQKHKNRYVFKCDLPNCSQIAQNFLVFSMHHEASCPKNPSCSKWKARQKPVSDYKKLISVEDNIAEGTRQEEGQMERMDDMWFAQNVFSDTRSTTKIVNTLLGPGRAKNVFLDSFRCKYCQNEYKKASYFHKQSRKFIFKCELPDCTKVTKNFLIFRQHHQATCPNKPFEDASYFDCKHCQTRYRKISYYIPETKRFIFKCDQPGCTVIAQNFPVFRKHHEATCPEKPPPITEAINCEICDRQFASAKTLQNHQIVFHTRNYSYFCDKCGVGAVSLAALNVHMLMHSERKHTCASCPASFRRKQHLLNHELRLHSQNFPHMCDTCGKRFSVRQGLRMHLQNMHGISGTGVCPICKKTFKSPHYVRNHIWSTHRKLRKPKSSTLKRKVNRTFTQPIKLQETSEIEMEDENAFTVLSTFSDNPQEDIVVTVAF